jgi:hypothetical protein
MLYFWIDDSRIVVPAQNDGFWKADILGSRQSSAITGQSIKTFTTLYSAPDSLRIVHIPLYLSFWQGIRMGMALIVSVGVLALVTLRSSRLNL